MADLTAKQELFCSEYLVDLNASGAARRAGYSEDTAGAIGWENLKKPEIQKRIQEMRDAIGKGFNITKERLAQELSRIAFFDIRKIYNESGGLKNIQTLSEDEAAAVAGIESFEEFEGYGEEREKTGDVRKVKIWEKTKAIESLVKLMGYAAPTKTEVTGENGKPIQTVTHVKIIRDKGITTPLSDTPHESATDIIGEEKI
jgi:phage terminase small subunit